MLVEQQTEWIINNILVNKGWNIDGDDQLKNVYFQKPKLTSQKQALKGKRPDYILYQTSTDRPIAVIEAKKGGVDLQPAIKQAKEYALALDAPLVFAMNGSYCETRFVPNDKELILNNEEVRELLREAEALEFLKANTNEVCTIPKEVLVSRNDLISIFADLNDALRSEGLRAGIERFSEFANILFLKLMSENNQKSWWESIKDQSNDHIIGYINDYVISQIQQEYGGGVFTPISIKNPKTLCHIINAIDPLVLSTIDSDIKGDAFEYFLEKTTSTQNDLGEYFTPRNIVKTTVNLVNPRFKEKIYDPFCGTGGFLTEAFNHIKVNTIIENHSTGEKILREFTVYGGELTTTARIAKMNMVLHGDGHSGIQQINSLANPIDGKYDIVVTNIPFSQKISRKIRGENGKNKTENLISPLYYNGLAKNNGDAACVLHCLRALKAGGRMAVVVPEGFLFRKDLTRVREFLLSKARLQTVISLPQGTFRPYTGVKTNILYFTAAHNRNNQKSYWFFDVKNIGVTLDNHKRKIKGMNDLNRVESSDIKRAEQNEDVIHNLLEIGFEIVDLAKVKAKDWNLAGGVYREACNNKEKYEWVRLGDVCEVVNGGTPNTKNDTYWNGSICWATIADTKGKYLYNTQKKISELGLKNSSAKTIPVNSVMLSSRATIGDVCIAKVETATNQGYKNFICRDNNILYYEYLYYILLGCKFEIEKLASGTTYKEISKEKVANFRIPLPPIEQQHEIVDELNGYQKIVDGARQVINSWKPHFDVHEEYERVRLGDVCEIIAGQSPKGKFYNNDGDGFPFYQGKALFGNKYLKEPVVWTKCLTKRAVRGDILMSVRAPVGDVNILPIDEACIGRGLASIRANSDKIDCVYLFYVLSSMKKAVSSVYGNFGSTFQSINKSQIEDIRIPLTSLHIQHEIVEQLEAERAMIKAQKKIIKTFECKIKRRIDALFEPQETPKGRPVENIIDPIDDTPENVAKSISKAPPKKKWNYMG